MNSIDRRAYALLTNDAADTAYYQQHNVVQHLGVRHVNGCHRLDRLRDERHRVQKRYDDEAENQCDHDDHKAPHIGLYFFNC